jgi:N-acetylmuramoyl-L-alanine amidase
MPPRTEEFHGAHLIPNRPAPSLPTRAHRNISAILFAVRNFSLLLTFLLAVSFSAAGPRAGAQSSSQAVAQQQPMPPSDSAPQQLSSVPVPTPAPASGPFIVLDPAHGGADPGARSESGGIEKDIVLRIAQSVRAELDRQGYRVMMTRNDDSNPSYDDRAAIANTYRDAIFVTLHVSSTGAPNTVRAYYNRFGTSPSGASIATDANAKDSTPPASSLTTWEEAQRPYVDASHRLADLTQRELAQFFSGSPVISSAAPVRGLRSIAAPAVAIEISSVSGADQNSLTASAVPIATAIGRSVAAFRQQVSAGAK